jgi:hypothetical protein
MFGATACAAVSPAGNSSGHNVGIKTLALWLLFAYVCKAILHTFAKRATGKRDFQQSGKAFPEETGR